ncbi:MAG: MarR family transcriptional regulator [Pseudolysinimonas sp.]|uniref:MarR family winged helix-turn-helix transcriptional regulator n=1 Tax=Pseudolysinimonas sp. TaxID=2680009 RepID=UPI00326560A9
MSTDPEAELGEPHVLDGFPAVAIRFVVALERNRVLIAQDHGLSASELRTMFYIAEHLRVTPKDLADHLGMTTGAITAISGRLVTVNLLHRVDHPKDRRSLYLQLTPHGDQVMAKIHEDFRTMIAAATNGLSPGQLKEFEFALASVSERIAGIVGL